MNLTFLKTVGTEALQFAPAAEALLGAKNPALGTLLTLAFNSIQSVASTSLSNPAKKAAVLTNLEQSAPAINSMLQAQGHAVIDPDTFTTAASGLVDNLVDIMKSTGAIVPTPAAAPDATLEQKFAALGYTAVPGAQVLVSGMPATPGMLITLTVSTPDPKAS